MHIYSLICIVSLQAFIALGVPHRRRHKHSRKCNVGIPIDTNITATAILPIPTDVEDVVDDDDEIVEFTPPATDTTVIETTSDIATTTTDIATSLTESAVIPNPTSSATEASPTLFEKAADNVVEPASGAEFTGDGTFYNPAGGYGACGTILNDNDPVVALSFAQIENVPCGSCLEVTGPKGTVKVTVMDKCAGCAYGDVDLAYGAFLQIADEAVGRLKVSSKVVPC